MNFTRPAADGRLPAPNNVQNYKSAQNYTTLSSAYAVIRAQQAADWQRFERYKDVLPNLRWVPSTSVKPGADHMVFWGTVLPIDHPFWSSHRPGDRWNCKCSLAATDEPATPSPEEGDIPLSSAPQRGLRDNPGKSGNLFGLSHPYFPSDCSACPFNSGFKNRLGSLFHNRKKDCSHCARINKALPKVDASSFVQKNKYANGGELMIHQQVDKTKADYKTIVNIAQHFAKAGKVVKITPSVHRKSEEYKQIYAPLIGSKYEGKCPDFKVGDKFYEFESFVRPWNKRKVRSMLSHGMKQSPYIVIDNTKGCSTRYIHNMIRARINTNAIIKEVYVYEGGKLRMIFKDGKYL